MMASARQSTWAPPSIPTGMAAVGGLVASALAVHSSSGISFAASPSAPALKSATPPLAISVDTGSARAAGGAAAAGFAHPAVTAAIVSTAFAASLSRRWGRSAFGSRHARHVIQFAATETKGETTTALDKVRTLTDRQEQFWEMLLEDLEDEVVPEFGRESLERVFDFIKYCKYEKEIPELPEYQDIDPEFFPGLTAKPWWDKEEIGDWVDKVVDGLPYVQGELADLLEDYEQDFITDSVKNNVMGGGWSGFRLQRQGTWIKQNADRFPRTCQLLRDAGVPLAMRGVIIARQTPFSGVQPHSDGRNMMLTAHFGLSIPEKCAITVGGIEKPWEDDGAIIFDTSFIHSTKNESDEDRFVLIVDFWHPDLTEPEWEALEYIYDFRTKFEQGKIKYVPKMPTDFWETMELYAPWGGAYTEEKAYANQGKDDSNEGKRFW